MMRRRLPSIMLAVFLACLLAAGLVFAQEIKVGAVQPITGRFAFAGVNINAGLEDALMMANEDGGINGKKIKYIMEDGQYQLDVATAAFKRIMSRDNPLIMYGESTGLGKAMSPEIKRYKVLYSSTSFSGELADPAANPFVFVPGPTYSDMFGILLKFIEKEKPGAKVAFFYSDTEFGKDPIPYAREMCKKLKLDLVAEEVAAVGAVDVTSQVLDLKRKAPDYVIFQGFVLSPVAEVIKQCRDYGMQCKFMGTFWGATKTLLDNLGPLAEGYLAVNPYMYWWNEDVPMIKKIREYTKKTYPKVAFRDNSYMQGFMTGLIFVECLKRADKAGQLNGDGLVKALQSLKDFDTGGLSAPYTIKDNKFPVARIWKANIGKKIYEPASDWIRLDE
ncbi:ABC transporter substrate-binding protein [Desulfomonile tiedjei]|uniref:Amino acid/amide ABC transporter substrate-binding protein, HAAT family n=1 Tax=Desulfomonile tiedjei (strain ATCC 49306 / DSM 6799 / DCB-1) TaxID=706587 RepID=I4C9U8_DESTA|nr:ABC transporter substrate-binding protein [Desulfomonile tiedjei]AFM26339.1 amino acid/amide ABC transporter substrate-binding protein, HAAT family [Desulfomonile tiedjei DSM 6799]